MHLTFGAESSNIVINGAFTLVLPIDTSKLSARQRQLFRQKGRCVQQDGSAQWSSTPCRTLSTSTLSIVCECRALGSFAVIYDLTAPGCGDGIRQVGEECDDSNNDDFDGCNANCKVEQNWRCSGSTPDTCACATNYFGRNCTRCTASHVMC